MAMASGKRLSTAEPLTEHDVAERLDKAALRTLRIMADARQQGYMDPVKHSRYLTNILGMLAAELRAWDVTPDESWITATDPRPGSPDSEFDVLGRDAEATCLLHRRRARWIPAPGWWIHDDGLEPANPARHGQGDPRTCMGLWAAPAPISVVRKEPAS